MLKAALQYRRLVTKWPAIINLHTGGRYQLGFNKEGNRTDSQKLPLELVTCEYTFQKDNS